MIDHLANITITLNYKGAEELAESTGFYLAVLIGNNLFDNPYSEFEINHWSFNIYVMPFFIEHHCDKGTFNLFISEDTHTLSIKNDVEFQKQLLEKVKLCIENLNEELSKYNVPTENLENVKFDQEQDCFYIKLGTPEPKTTVIQCRLDESVEEFAYWW